MVGILGAIALALTGVFVVYLGAHMSSYDAGDVMCKGLTMGFGVACAALAMALVVG